MSAARANRKLSRSLYAALFRSTCRLQSELARGNVALATDCLFLVSPFQAEFTQYKCTHPDEPAASTVSGRGSKSGSDAPASAPFGATSHASATHPDLLAVLRSNFRQAAQKAQSDADLVQPSIDKGFQVLRTLNQRCGYLEKMVYSRVSEALSVNKDISVRVHSWHSPEPSITLNVHEYEVTITNHSMRNTYKLLSRSWEIHHVTGKVETIRGDGVVGKQPVLQPGESHTYRSFTLLPCAVGTMKGQYTLINLKTGQECTARVAPFGLMVDDAVQVQE
mmetsp:Transcript_8131/g.20485  ORF Transcript_8131/g.20485 Transcript_8131/m.20485 type:complete len:279 (+) Transcript_8131:122-958(+)